MKNIKKSSTTSYPCLQLEENQDGSNQWRKKREREKEEKKKEKKKDLRLFGSISLVWDQIFQKQVF